MARLGFCGFQSQSALIDFTSATLPSGVSYDTSIFRTGDTSLKIVAPSGAAASVTIAGATATVYTRCYVRVTVRPATARLLLGSSTFVGIWLNPDGTLAYKNGATTIGTSTTTLTDTSRWYRIEYRVATTTSAGLLWIDGATEVSGTISSPVGAVAIGPADTVAATYTAYFADWACDNGSLPGDGNIVWMHPTADGAVGSGWQKPGGVTTNLYTSVDNRPPTGVADSTSAANAERQIRNASANTAYEASLPSPTALGIGASDTINAIQSYVVVGAPVSTGAKTGSQQFSANISTAATAFAANSGQFWTGVAAGTYPTGWKVERGAIVSSPTLLSGLGGAIKLQINISGGTASRIALITAMGAYLDYAPAASISAVSNVARDFTDQTTATVVNIVGGGSSALALVGSATATVAGGGGGSTTSAVSLPATTGYGTAANTAAIGNATALAIKMRIRGDWFNPATTGYHRILQIDAALTGTANLKLVLGFRSETSGGGVVMYDTVDNSLTARQLGSVGKASFDTTKYYIFYFHYDPSSATEIMRAQITLDESPNTVVLNASSNTLQTGALDAGSTFGIVRLHRDYTGIGTRDAAVDGLAIYSAPLASGDRTTEPSASDTNLLAYWPINEGSGDAAEINGGNTLVLTNETWLNEGIWPSGGLATLNAISDLLVPLAGTSTATISLSASSSLPLPLSETTTGTVGIAASSTRALGLSETTTAVVGFAAATTRTLALAGSATTTVGISASSLATLLSGSATATVSLSASSTVVVPLTSSAAATVLATLVSSVARALSGSATGTVGVALSSSLTLALAGSTTGTVSSAAASTIARLLGNSATALVGTGAQSVLIIPLAGTTASSVGIAAQTAFLIPLVGSGTASVLNTAISSVALARSGSSIAVVSVSAESVTSLVRASISTSVVGIAASSLGSYALTGSASANVGVDAQSTQLLALLGAATSSVSLAAASTVLRALSGLASAVVALNAESTQPIVLDGSASTTLAIALDSTQSLALTGLTDATVLVSADSVLPLVLTGLADVETTSGFHSTQMLPLAGSAQASVLVRAESDVARALVGIADASVASSLASSIAIALAGSANSVILTDLVSDVLRAIGGTASAIVIIPGTSAVSSRALPFAGSAAASVLVSAQSVRARALAGTAAAAALVTAVSDVSYHVGGVASAFSQSQYATTGSYRIGGSADASVLVRGVSLLHLPLTGSTAASVLVQVASDRVLSLVGSVRAVLVVEEEPILVVGTLHPVDLPHALLWTPKEHELVRVPLTVQLIPADLAVALHDATPHTIVERVLLTPTLSRSIPSRR